MAARHGKRLATGKQQTCGGLIADGFSYRLADNRGVAPLRYGLDSWGEHLNAILYHAETDPFLDWLKSLPIWDGTKRLRGLLTDTLQGGGWAADPMGKHLPLFGGSSTGLRAWLFTARNSHSYLSATSGQEFAAKQFVATGSSPPGFPMQSTWRTRPRSAWNPR